MTGYLRSPGDTPVGLQSLGVGHGHTQKASLGWLIPSQTVGLPQVREPPIGRGGDGVENWVLVGVAWLFWRLVSELESHHQQPAGRPVEERKEINLAPSLELY